MRGKLVTKTLTDHLGNEFDQLYLDIWREHMNERLTKKLIEKYPEIFPENFGFEHRDGWYWLIDELCAYLQFETKYNEMPQIRATQVKEKFGTLRFYYKRIKGDTPERAWGAIRFAEAMSHIICESCGSPGATRKERNMWMSTLCAKCDIAMNMEDLDPEISESVNKNFWSLVGEDDTEYEQEELFKNGKHKEN